MLRVFDSLTINLLSVGQIAVPSASSLLNFFDRACCERRLTIWYSLQEAGVFFTSFRTLLLECNLSEEVAPGFSTVIHDTNFHF